MFATCSTDGSTAATNQSNGKTLMLYAFLVSIALVWALAYATGYAKGQQMTVLKLRILRTLADDRAKNPQRWN